LKIQLQLASDAVRFFKYYLKKNMFFDNLSQIQWAFREYKQGERILGTSLEKEESKVTHKENW